MSTATSYSGRSPQSPPSLGKLFDRLPPHAVEAEMSLLGAMILDGRMIGDVVQILTGPDDFYQTRHAAIYQALVRLYDQNNPIDLVQLRQALADSQALEEAGGVEYLVELAESVPAATSAPYYAKIVRDKATLRRLIEAAGEILQRAYTSAEDASDQVDSAEREIFRLAESGNAAEAGALGVLLQETFAQLEAREGQQLTGLETGFFELDEITTGLQKGEMVIVAARPSMGKAQPLDAKVLTPDGWTTMGELQIGDRLASIDGQSSEVTGIFPQGRRQVFRVVLSDGRSTECCAEHLWQVHYRGWDAPRVLDTAKLMSLLKRKRYENRLWIETFAGEFGSDDELLLDPYLLGCLIGDGTLGGSSVRFSCKDEQTLERISQIIGPDVVLRPAGGYDYRLVQAAGAHQSGVQGVAANPIKQALEELGLWGCGATQKFIPPVYLRASRQSRAALLAGLVDTDGWVETWGSLRFSSASVVLARDVVDLVRSLGGSGSVTRKNTRYTYQGMERRGLPAYVCNLQHDQAADLVRADVKRDHLVSGRQRQRRLNIQSIEPTRIADTQCIAVSHPDRLYVTDDYIVTHNTAFALNIAEHVAATNRQPLAVFSLEMSRQQLAQRLLCSRSGVDAQRVRRNMLGADEYERLAMTVGELAEAPLFIDDTPGLSLLQLRARARRLAARHDIRMVIIDYLQLMSSPGAESRQQEVSELSRGIKALARELNVPVICLSQLNRAAESREGHRPRMSDLRESGSIEQDADVVMMLHREEYYHSDPNWAAENPDKVGVAEVIIAKQRNGPTGTIRLQFNGRTTRFNNLAHGGDYEGYGSGSDGGGAARPAGRGGVDDEPF